MTDERRRPGLSTAAIAAAAAVAGGAIALGIGAAAGWVGAGDTVVLSSVEPPAELVAAPPVEDPPSSTEAEAPDDPASPQGSAAFDPAALYRERAPGVVTIYAVYPNHAGTDIDAEGQGSGFVVSPEGYILTNSHVVTTAGMQDDLAADAEPATQVYVEFADGDRVGAEVVGWDVFYDIGVVKVDPAEHELSPLPLGDSAAVVVGEPVAAIGSPFGQAGSLTVGVVSAIERSVDSLTSGYNVVDAIQTDAPINRGNSGGPLFNARGEVIGINAQIRSESGNAEGVGFAIPINVARRSMEQLVATGEVRYAWIGVSTRTLTASLAEEAGAAVDSGAAIECVVSGSPASRAGLQGGDRDVSADGLPFVAGGDIVVAIDGEEVATSEDLGRIVATGLLPGETATFTVVRDGERIDVPVVLGERPSEPQGGC
jgi:S1-C subfamily serine protease